MSEQRSTARASLKVRLTRQIVVVISILLAWFSAITLAAVAGYLYHDAHRDTRTILHNLTSQHREAVQEVIRAYNRPTDPRIWMLRQGIVVAQSPNAKPRPRDPQHTGILRHPVTYQLAAAVGRSQFVIDWPLTSDWLLLRDLSIIVVAVTLTGMGAGVAVARWTTRRTLGPVKSMTSGVQRMLNTGEIGPIPLPSGRDEFHDLAGLLNRLLANLEEQRQRDQQFISNATHQLRTPLAVIQGNMDRVLRAHPAAQDSHKESVSTLYRTVDDMAHLIDDLLTMENAANLSQALLQPMRLDEMTREVIEDVRALTTDRHELSVDGCCPKGRPWSVMAYPAFARRAFWAVMENALTYCDAIAGHVTVEVVEDAERGFVGIAIGNNGLGILPEELPLVVSRFYRGTSGRTSGQGTGLGLALAQSLMRAQQGTLGLVSSSTWTRVTLWFRKAAAFADDGTFIQN